MCQLQASQRHHVHAIPHKKDSKTRCSSPTWLPRLLRGLYRLSIRLFMLASESSPCLLHSCRSRSMQLQLKEREREESVTLRDGIPAVPGSAAGRGHSWVALLALLPPL